MRIKKELDWQKKANVNLACLQLLHTKLALKPCISECNIGIWFGASYTKVLICIFFFTLRAQLTRYITVQKLKWGGEGRGCWFHCCNMKVNFRQQSMILWRRTIAQNWKGKSSKLTNWLEAILTRRRYLDFKLNPLASF